MSEIDIRPAGHADRIGILDLLKRSLGWTDDPRFQQLFEWKHERNPFGVSPAWVATDGERVVAVRIFMRWEFLRGGDVVRAVRAVDTATDPDYQGRGLFTSLTMHGLRAMEAQGVSFVFNTPNSQSLPGYRKMGWQEVGRLTASFGLGSPLKVPKLVKARVPSDLWSQPVTVGHGFDEWATTYSLPSPPDLPIHTIATNATSDFLRWRFGFEPLRYRVLKHNHGAIVFRTRHRGPALELVQVAAFGLSPFERDRAIRTAVKLTGADYGIRLGAPNPRAGLMPLPGGGPIFTWRALNEHSTPPLSNWSLSMGDIELF